MHMTFNKLIEKWFNFSCDILSLVFALLFQYLKSWYAKFNWTEWVLSLAQMNIVLQQILNLASKIISISKKRVYQPNMKTSSNHNL